MLAYTKQNFEDGDVLYAHQLNKIDDGIIAVHDALEEKQPKGNYLTEVPSGYATEEYVRNKIAEAELNDKDVDLSGYVQKAELPLEIETILEQAKENGEFDAPTPDWNASEGESGYILNRTHWIEPESVVLAETDIPYNNLYECYRLNDFIPIEAEKDYCIVYNGNSYICKSGSDSVIGNKALVNAGLDTGEPFVIASSQDEYDGGFFFFVKSNEPSVRVKIMKAENVHPISEEFLPKSVVKKFVVNVTGDDINGYAADKTVMEVYKAYLDGKAVYCALNVEGLLVEIPLVGGHYESGTLFFSHASGEEILTIIFTATDGSIQVLMKNIREVSLSGLSITEEGKTTQVYDGTGPVTITIPSVEGLASKDYVDNALNNLDIPDPDLSEYVTKEEVNKTIAAIEFPDETDPTVPEWAKQPTKPNYTASDVGADELGTAESKVSSHNTDNNAHNDIRSLINSKAEASHTHTKSQITDFPTTMKNPKSLSINGVSYDGSNYVSVNTPKPFYIKITSNGDGTYSVDKTPQEITVAYENGDTIYAIAPVNWYYGYDVCIYDTDVFNANFVDGVYYVSGKFSFNKCIESDYITYFINNLEIWNDGGNTFKVDYYCKEVSSPTINYISDSIDDVYISLSDHDSSTSAHSDIRTSLNEKVNISDVVNSLTSNETDKPLSAAQGAALKSLIDDIDKSLDNDYALKSEIPSAPVESVNGKTGVVNLVASDVGAMPSDTIIPSKTSELENDSGFLTSVPTKTSELENDSGFLTSVPTKTSELTNDSNFLSVVTVKNYGALGDGSTDDTKAFQDALAENRVVYVPGGTYILSDTIVIGANCCLELSQDTVLKFTQTDKNAITMLRIANLKGNHATIFVPYTFSANVINCDGGEDYARLDPNNIATSNTTAVPPFKKWDPQWKMSRYIADINVCKVMETGSAGTSNFHYSADGTCYGTAIYIHCNAEDYPVSYMWGVSMSGVRIAGGFNYGIRIHNIGEHKKCWNHDARIEAVIDACKIGVSVENAYYNHLAVTIQPRPAADGTAYSEHGVKIVDSWGTDLSGYRVWDWTTKDDDTGKTVNSKWEPDNEYQHIAMYGNCTGTLLDGFLTYAQSTYDIRELIYTDTPSNFDTMTVIQDQVDKRFKVEEGEPYFLNGTSSQKLITQSDMKGYFDTNIIKEFKDVLETAIDKNNEIYNGIGYKNNTRLENNGTEATSQYHVATGFIPCKKGDVFYTHHMSMKAGDSYCRVAFFDKDFNAIKDSNGYYSLVNRNNLINNGNVNSVTYTELDEGFKLEISTRAVHDQTAYMRLVVSKTVWGNNPMISLDNEIKYTQSGFLADGVKVKAENVNGLLDTEGFLADGIKVKYENIDGAPEIESTPIITDAVRYVEQDLTPEQQAQARKNIGIDDNQAGIIELQPLTINGVTYDGSEAVDLVIEGGSMSQGSSLGQTPVTLSKSAEIKLVGDGECSYTVAGKTFADLSTAEITTKYAQLTKQDDYIELTVTGTVSQWYQPLCEAVFKGFTVGESYVFCFESFGSDTSNLTCSGYFQIYNEGNTVDYIVRAEPTTAGLQKLNFVPTKENIIVRWQPANSTFWNNGYRTALVGDLYINKTSDGTVRTPVYNESGTFTDSYSFGQLPSCVTITSEPSCEVYSVQSTEGSGGSGGASLPLEGKNVVCFGDSMIGYNTTSTSATAFIAKKTGATVHNVGFSGCRMSEHPYTSNNPFSMYALANAIASGDWSLQDANAASGSDNFPDQLALLKSIDFNAVDIVVIHYGTNDFTAGEGREIDNTDKTNATNTLCGALRYSVETLLTAYPNLNIFVSLPTFRYWKTSDGKVTYSNTWTNTLGKTLPEYVNAIAETAKEYNLPVIDCYYGLCINKINASTFLLEEGNSTDGYVGVHHTLEGRKRFGEFIGAKLISN